MKGCLGKLGQGILVAIGGSIVVIVLGVVLRTALPSTAFVPDAKTPQAKTPQAKTLASSNAVILVPTVIEPTDAPTDTPVPEPTETPLPAVGQDVQVDEVRWKILSVDNLGSKIVSTNQFVKDKTTSGVFIKVRFEVENRSKDMLSFAGLDLVDDKGRKYTRSSDTFPGVDSDEDCFIENLNPNITKTCTQMYEVPKDATGLMADAGDLKVFGSTDALINLEK